MTYQTEDLGKGLRGEVADHGVLAGLPMDLQRAMGRGADDVSRLRFETLEMGVPADVVRSGAAESGAI